MLRWNFLILYAIVAFPLPAFAQIRDDGAALKTLKVPEGFEIRVFAGPDMISNPTAIDVDVYGRVWVTEGVNYRSSFNPGPGAKDPKGDRIKILEDTDGDGRADKVTVVCEGIPIVPMSICVADDKAHVGVAPEWWMLGGASLKQPNDKQKSVLLSGFHRSGRKTGWVDHDHALHGIMLGPDGRIYFTVGDEGMAVTDHSGKSHKPNGAAVVRMEPDGTQMRVLADNLRNPYEPCVDSFGRVFCSDNDDDGNAQVRICHIIDGGDYGYRHNLKLHRSPTNHHWHEDVPGVTPKILRTGQGSPCGIIVYEGKLLPERFRGSLIHCDNGASPDAVVRAYHLKSTGAGFDCQIENLVTSTDKWFRPVDVAHAADGSLYIADWYDSGVGGHGYRDKVIGRIYHLTVKGAPLPAKAPLPELDTIPGLCSALMSPMPSVRYIAIKKLRALDADAAAALANMARPNKHPLERARALWVLFGMGDIGRNMIVATLKDADPRFRAMAVRMLREDTERNLDAILPSANDADAEVRLEVTVALRDVTTEKCKSALLTLAKRLDPKDMWACPTLGATLRNREPEFIKELFNDPVAIADEARLLAIAWQINRPETLPFLSHVLQKPKEAEHHDRALQALGWIKSVGAGEIVVAAAIAETDANRMRASLDLLRGRIGGPWSSLVDMRSLFQLFLRTRDNEELAPAMLAVIGAGRAGTFAPDVIKIAEDPKRNPATRKAALDALGEIDLPDCLKTLTTTIHAARQPKPDALPLELATAALRALPAESKDADELLVDVFHQREYPLELRRESIKQLSRTKSGCDFLLSAAEKGTLPVEFKGTVTELLNRAPDKKVRERAAVLLPLPKLADKRTLSPADEVLKRTGDAKRGETAFFKPESQCAKCHRVAGVGAWVGPDLSQIGGKLGKDGLLESLLYPSAAVAHEYVQYQIETKKGQLLTGIVVEENAERIILKNADGERLTVAANDIASKSARPESIMPERLVESLTDQELVDLLAYLETLKHSSLPINAWNVAGPLATDVSLNVEKGIDLKATYDGKNGSRVTWRKFVADREGRLDLEAAIGTCDGAAFLHAELESKTEQTGRLVVLVPNGVRVRGWIRGDMLNWESNPNHSDQSQRAFASEIRLRPGKNEVVLKITGRKETPLAVIATVISPNGVEAHRAKE